MTYRGEMDVERRQTAKAKQEGRPAARTFPTDCDECGEDCYRSLGCRRKACPYASISMGEG